MQRPTPRPLAAHAAKCPMARMDSRDATRFGARGGSRCAAWRDNCVAAPASGRDQASPDRTGGGPSRTELIGCAITIWAFLAIALFGG